MDKQTLATIENMLKADQQEHEETRQRALESASDYSGAEDLLKDAKTKKDDDLIAEYKKEKQEAAQRNAKDVADYRLLESRIRVNQRIINRNKN